MNTKPKILAQGLNQDAGALVERSTAPAMRDAVIDVEFHEVRDYDDWSDFPPQGEALYRAEKWVWDNFVKLFIGGIVAMLLLNGALYGFCR